MTSFTRTDDKSRPRQLIVNTDLLFHVYVLQNHLVAVEVDPGDDCGPGLLLPAVVSFHQAAINKYSRKVCRHNSWKPGI